jgi:hypothetical protein
MACLEKAPENRPASALELWCALGKKIRFGRGDSSSETMLVPAQ